MCSTVEWVSLLVGFPLEARDLAMCRSFVNYTSTCESLTSDNQNNYVTVIYHEDFLVAV